MSGWDLTNENDLAEIATRYHEASAHLLLDDHENGEIRPQSTRRELIAHSFGLTVDELMDAVVEGTRINWERHTADWTPEQHAEHEEHVRRTLYPLIAEAFVEHEARQKEIDELNRLYDL